MTLLSTIVRAGGVAGIAVAGALGARELLAADAPDRVGPPVPHPGARPTREQVIRATIDGDWTTPTERRATSQAIASGRSAAEVRAIFDALQGTSWPTRLEADAFAKALQSTLGAREISRSARWADGLGLRAELEHGRFVSRLGD